LKKLFLKKLRSKRLHFFSKMSMSFSQSLQESHGFDCSAFVGQKLRWSSNDCRHKLDLYSASSTSEHFYTKECEMKPVTNFDWTAQPVPHHAVSHRVTAKSFQEEKAPENYLEEQYYASEYKTLVDWMDEGADMTPALSQLSDKRKEIQKLSVLAEKALLELPTNGPTCEDLYERFAGYEDFANEFDIKPIETPCEVIQTSHQVISPCQVMSPRQVMSPGDFQNFVEEQLVGFGETPKQAKDGIVRKRRLCRHFVKGFCLRGDSCAFLHDPSIFCCDEQKVFLGGLPLHLTPQLLKAMLEEKGLTVLNKPSIMRGFSPQVCLSTVEEAKRLVAQKYIYIGDQRVDVRPYQEEDKLRKTFPSVMKRSVFLGGLPENTTGEMIMKDMQRLDIKVEVLPVVKSGYAPRVILASLKDAKMLVALKRVLVNGTVVDVRPYVNFRKRY